MKNLIAIVFVMLTGLSVVLAGGPESDDLLNAATCVVDETAQRSYSTSQSGEKKISYASAIPAPDEKNVVITFTINEHNKIHVVDVKGGYAFLNHYIKSSLEGKVIKTENALPGINYVMAVKLPTSV